MLNKSSKSDTLKFLIFAIIILFTHYLFNFTNFGKILSVLMDKDNTYKLMSIIMIVNFVFAGIIGVTLIYCGFKKNAILVFQISLLIFSITLGLGLPSAFGIKSKFYVEEKTASPTLQTSTIKNKL